MSLTELEHLRDIIKQQMSIMALCCKRCKDAQAKVYELLDGQKTENYLDTATKTLMADEQFRSRIYLCSSGRQTIGFGFDVDDTPITYEDALYLLEQAVKRTDLTLQSTFSFYPTLTIPRKIALINMLYCHGLNRFRKYKKMLSALENKDYKTAANEILDSTWAKSQAHNRAKRIAMIIRTDTLTGYERII